MGAGKGGGGENIRQLFTRQLRGVTSVREANERLSGATPIRSRHIVKFRVTNTSPARDGVATLDVRVHPDGAAILVPEKSVVSS